MSTEWDMCIEEKLIDVLPDSPDMILHISLCYLVRMECTIVIDWIGGIGYLKMLLSGQKDLMRRESHLIFRRTGMPSKGRV